MNLNSVIGLVSLCSLGEGEGKAGTDEAAANVTPSISRLSSEITDLFNGGAWGDRQRTPWPQTCL